MTEQSYWLTFSMARSSCKIIVSRTKNKARRKRYKLGFITEGTNVVIYNIAGIHPYIKLQDKNGDFFH